jgi:hypothetical protein
MKDIIGFMLFVICMVVLLHILIKTQEAISIPKELGKSWKEFKDEFDKGAEPDTIKGAVYIIHTDSTGIMTMPDSATRREMEEIQRRYKERHP